MSQRVCRSIHLRFLPILKEASARYRVVDLQDLLLRLTFDNICGLAFGKDPETLALDLLENASAVAFDNAAEASLHRFIFLEFVWRFNKWLQVGMEATLTCSVAHVDGYLSAIIKARKLELRDGRNYVNVLSPFCRRALTPTLFSSMWWSRSASFFSWSRRILEPQR
ncbi:cytochrome P450 86A7-like [Musa acuminata AAA Group]|uniref:cytochrome P450 86A7-like n=1 Tax=Musa acuminata AAA Group TaxID=214697 RepID=UPI0031D65999